MMRILRGLLSLATLVASVLLVPWLLLGLGHYPAPGELDWQRLLVTPDDGRVLLWLVTALGWVVWLAFTVSTALDVSALLGRRRVRLPGLQWMQGISGALLIAVLVMLGSQDGPRLIDSTPGSSASIAVAHALPSQAAPPVAVRADGIAADPVLSVEYTVQRGDDLWTIAETHLGNGADWRRIVELNPDLLAGDPDHLRPGWVLRLPSPAATPVQQTPTTVTPTPEATATLAPQDPELPPPPVATDTAPQSSEHVEAAQDEDPGATERIRLLGGTAPLVAAGVTSLLAARHLRQRVQRPLGTLPQPVSDATRRFRNALAATPLPPAVELVGWAVHLVARQCQQRGTLPDLDWLRAGPEGFEFRWSRPIPAAAPFVADGSSWLVDLATVSAAGAAAPDTELLRPWPTLVTVGTERDDTYLVDLERWGRVSVHAESGRRAGEVLTSYLTELVSAPWAGGARVTVVGDDAAILDIGDGENIVRAATLQEVLPAWESTAATQQSLAAVADEPNGLLRLDPDFAEAWAPQVLVLLTDITPAERSRLTARFTRAVRGPLVLLSEQPGADAALVVDESPLRSRWEPADIQMAPHLVPVPVRDAVVELTRASAPLALVLAPWWGSHPDTTATAAQELPMTDAPRLLMIGPVVLEGAQGTPPSRAPRQCLEYCAWLLEHPNSSSVEMARALMVAEPTRRSNTSRLRGWLGTDDDGRPYLPEAYSGRIRLHPSVRSDWQEVQILLGRSMDLASDATLAAILDLVRGAPLADAPPGGWTWAEEMRIAAAAALRDVAYALAERCLEANDLDRARWAIGRGLVASPGDETLLRLLLVCESRVGNLHEVERLVFRLNAQARSLGVDLLPETVTTMQRVLEGRIRSRGVPSPSRAAV